METTTAAVSNDDEIEDCTSKKVGMLSLIWDLKSNEPSEVLPVLVC